MQMIQWYPGHIAKYEKQLLPLLKQVDVLIEVLDARLPATSAYAKLRSDEIQKPRVILLNKSDLSDPAQNTAWENALKAQGFPVLLYDGRKRGKQQVALVNTLLRLGRAKNTQRLAKGMLQRPIRTLVVGMPNVGKSMIINSIVGRKKAKTGHKAGVTRQPQWVRIHPQVELLDSPGIIPPKLDSERSGALLAVVSAVGDAAYDEEAVAQFLLDTIVASYPDRCQTYYHLGPDSPLNLLAIAESRQYRHPGGDWNQLRAAQAVLSDFRQGSFGPITLDRFGETLL